MNENVIALLPVERGVERMMSTSLRYRHLVLIAGLAAGCSQNSRADDGVLFKAKHQPGDRHYIEVKKAARQTVGGGVLGQDFMKTRVDEVMGVLSEVKSVTGDGIAIDLNFERTGQRIQVMQSNWNYDSDTSPNTESVIGRPMGAMLGRSVQMMLDSEGRPQSLTGMVALIEDMDYASAGHPVSAQFFREFKNVVTDDLMRFQWGDLSANLYPNRAVKVGDTWTSSAQAPSPFSGIVVRNYRCSVDKIAEVEGRKLVSISYEASIENAPDGRSLIDSNGQTVEFLSGELTGKATFDAARGYIVRQEEHSKESRLVHMGKKSTAERKNTEAVQATMVTELDLEIRRLTVEERKKEKAAR